MVMDELKLRRLSGRLRAEADSGRRTQRLLTRQHHLIRRLGDSLEDRIRLRTSELTRENQSLRAEIALHEHTDAALQGPKRRPRRRTRPRASSSRA